MRQLGRVALLPLGFGIGVLPLTLNRSPELIRVAAAVGIVSAMVIVLIRNARLATLLVLWFLPVLALVRRILIPVAGWTSYDALLLVAPIVATFLLCRVFLVEKRPLARDLASKAVLIVMVLAVIQVVNPKAGGLVAGLTGLLFLAAPLSWYFIGRELADRQLIGKLLNGTVILATGIAGYGLWQSLVGFMPWDSAWADLNGYASLSVLGVTRAFGTFSSGSEYAFFLAAGLVIALVTGLTGRPRAFLALPILASGIFLESSRTIVFLILLSVAGLIGIRTGRKSFTAVAVGSFVVVALATIHFVGPQLTTAAQQSGSSLIAHQVAGLMNPFDPNQSTLLLHQHFISNGLVGTLQEPLGMGTASTNLAGQKLGVSSNSAEVDIVDAFISLGILGGFAFAVVVILTLWRSISLAFVTRDVCGIAVLGILVVTFGQWLNGGYYAVSPLVWLLAGWTNREWLARRQQTLAIGVERGYAHAEGFPRTGWSPI